MRINIKTLFMGDVMSYKMICVDIDGTILNDKHKLTEDTKKALKEAHDKGLHVVICSGRLFSDAEYYSNLLGVNSSIVGSNGTIIKDKKNDEFIFKKILGKNTCSKLLKIFSKHNIKASFYTTDKVYSSNFKFTLLLFLGKLIGVVSRNTKLKYIFNKKQWQQMIDTSVDNIYKCEVTVKDIDKLNALKKELKQLHDIELVNQAADNIEISSKGITKGSAVKFLTKYYNIKKEEVITIGDSGNDLPMIEYAGLGVAMGNAFEDVKERADYITDSNNDSGVAKVINEFVLTDQLRKIV